MARVMHLRSLQRARETGRRLDSARLRLSEHLEVGASEHLKVDVTELGEGARDEVLEAVDFH